MPDIYTAPPENKPTEENKQPLEKNPTPIKGNVNLNLKNGKLIKKISHKISIGNALNSFAAYPKGVRFQTQEDKEEIILLFRRHFITNFLWIFSAIIMLILPLALTPLSGILISVNIPANFQLIGLASWYSLIIGFIIFNLLFWYYNVYLITDQRIIDVDFYSLTYKKIASATLDNVQDITIRSGGILCVIFDFADIDIQTAGTIPNFTFEAVPHPDIIAREIHDLLDDYKMYLNKDNYGHKQS